MSETTALSPEQERAFMAWVQANQTAPGVGNFADPASKYDMRGFWNDKDALQQWTPGDHFPDTYKQHGHPKFSAESKYSRGLQDGGQWLGTDTLMPPPMPSHAVAPDKIRQALLALMRQR